MKLFCDSLRQVVEDLGKKGQYSMCSKVTFPLRQASDTYMHNHACVPGTFRRLFLLTAAQVTAHVLNRCRLAQICSQNMCRDLSQTRFLQIFSFRMSEEEEKFSKIDFLMLRDQDDQYILDNMELLKDKIQRSFNQEELNNLLLTTIKDHPFSQYVIDLLIDSGADVDHQDKDGDTAVHLAVSFNGLKVDLEALDRRREILLEALLDHGADVEIKNYFGQTACDIAKENKDLYPNIYKTFLKHSIKMGLATGRPKIDHIDPELYSFATNCESEIRALARIRIKGHFTLCHILYSLKARNSFNRILWEKLDVIFEHFYLEISQCFPLYASCLRSSYRKVRRSRSSLLNVAVDSCSSSRRILPVQMLPIELRFKILKCLSAKDLENFINSEEYDRQFLPPKARFASRDLFTICDSCFSRT